MSEYSYQGPEMATPTELGIAYDTAATWLQEHGEQIVPARGILRDFQGIPIGDRRLEYSIATTGDMVHQFAPLAAEQLCVEADDEICVQFYPAMYGLRANQTLGDQITLDDVEGCEFIEPEVVVTAHNGFAEVAVRLGPSEMDETAPFAADIEDARFDGMPDVRDSLTRAEVAGLQELFEALPNIDLMNRAADGFLLEGVVDLGDLGFNDL